MPGMRLGLWIIDMQSGAGSAGHTLHLALIPTQQHELMQLDQREFKID